MLRRIVVNRLGICIDIAQSTIIIVQFLCIELNSCIYDLYLKIGITI